MRTPEDYFISPPPGIDLAASLVYRNITPAPFMDVFRNFIKPEVLTNAAA